MALCPPKYATGRTVVGLHCILTLQLIKTNH